MRKFIEKIRNVYPLSDKALSLFLEKTERAFYPKGHLLIRSDVTARYSYFIISGYARGFFYKEERDVTIWFASSGMSLLSMNGYMFGSAGYENIELLEDCDLLKISNESLNGLFEENIELANWGRRMSDQIILELEKLVMERCFISASERYHLLIKQEPEILQKVPLRHIASYLGISQVSLSRIRAGVQ
ncbi:Crp/Fnr family transcriptional regulator [Coprobacter sp.]